jgi:dihydrofolate synthase/folylpolyglutamate synthase
LAFLDTGLGGRHDATTAANAEIAAITQIAMDHREYLGNTIEEIAAEKAGIIRRGSRAVIGSQAPEAMEVILDHCKRSGVVPLTFCEPHIWATDMLKRSAVVEFRTNRDVYRDSSLGLAGRHQVDNACVTVLVSEVLAHDLGLAISKENIWSGLENATHPGRLEYVGNSLLDGAHNAAGAKALRAYLDEFETRPITMIFGAMEDKDVSEMTSILFPRAERVFLTRPNNARALAARELRSFMPSNSIDAEVTETSSLTEALEKAKQMTGPDGLVLITGSLYLVGEAKRILNN